MEGSFAKEAFNNQGGSDTPCHLVLHPQHMDDSMLWTAFRSGDEKAFITIFDRYSQLLFNYGTKLIKEREVVKDSIQELFIEIWQNRARLGETDSIKFYLLKSIRRKIIRLKGKADYAFPPPPYTPYDEEVSPSHEFVLIAEQDIMEKREKVMLMLGRLTKRQHEALFLRYFEELNSDQIAAVMNVSKQAVYNLIHHALDQLKKEMSAPVSP